MNDNVKEKAAIAFGFDGPEASDLVNRADYATQAEYYAALADMKIRLQDPEFQRAIRKARMSGQVEDERAKRKRELEEFKQYRKSANVEEFEQRDIDKQAAQMARDDLARGKISSAELGERIAIYADRLSDKLKDQKASSAQINALFRKQLGR